MNIKDYLKTIFPSLVFLLLPIAGHPQTCNDYTVNALTNCNNTNSIPAFALAGVSFPVVAGQNYTISILTGDPNNAMYFGAGTDADGNPVSFYGTRLRIYQYSVPGAIDATLLGTVGNGSAEEMMTEYGSFNVFFVTPENYFGEYIYNTSAAANSDLTTHPAYDTFSFTATTSYISLGPDELYTCCCGDNSGNETVQVCGTSSGGPTPTPMVSPTPSPSPSPTPSPTPTRTVTATNTPTVTATSSVTATPTFANCNEFYVSMNVMMSRQGPVSLYVAYCGYPGELSLRIYNSAGEHIRTLEDRQVGESWSSAYQWDGTNKYGDHCASGVYLFYLEQPNARQIKKLVLVR